MTPASLSQTSAIAAPAPPDINAETYPFDVVL